MFQFERTPIAAMTTPLSHSLLRLLTFKYSSNIHNFPLQSLVFVFLCLDVDSSEFPLKNLWVLRRIDQLYCAIALGFFVIEKAFTKFI